MLTMVLQCFTIHLIENPLCRGQLVSTGVSSLDQVLGNGYPDKSSVLILGQSGLGKQALGY